MFNFCSPGTVTGVNVIQTMGKLLGTTSHSLGPHSLVSLTPTPQPGSGKVEVVVSEGISTDQNQDSWVSQRWWFCDIHFRLFIYNFHLVVLVKYCCDREMWILISFSTRLVYSSIKAEGFNNLAYWNTTCWLQTLWRKDDLKRARSNFTGYWSFHNSTNDSQTKGLTVQRYMIKNFWIKSLQYKWFPVKIVQMFLWKSIICFCESVPSMWHVGVP